MGLPPRPPIPPEVHHYEVPYHSAPWKAITWKEIMDARRERQRMILERKCHDYDGSWRPVFLDTRFYDMDIYGGWQCYIYGIDFAHWIQDSQRGQENTFMEMFPLRDGLFPLNFYNWKRVFAETYTRGTFCDRPRGRVMIWARVTGRAQYAAISQYALEKPSKTGVQRANE